MPRSSQNLKDLALVALCAAVQRDIENHADAANWKRVFRLSRRVCGRNPFPNLSDFPSKMLQYYPVKSSIFNLSLLRTPDWARTILICREPLTWLLICSISRKYAKAIVSSLSPELTRSVVNLLLKRFCCAGFFLACMLSSELAEIVVPSTEFMRQAVNFLVAQSPLAKLLSTLSEGLTKLDMGDIIFHDSAMQALAGSEASKTLRSLRISNPRLTEKVADCWCTLTALRELFIGRGDVEWTKILEALCSHKKLKRLVVDGSGSRLIHRILAPDSLPSLRYLSCDWIENLRPRDLKDLLLARPNAEKLKGLDFGNDVSRDGDGLSFLGVHLLCPRLRNLLPDLQGQPIVVDAKAESIRSHSGRKEIPLRNFRNATFIHSAAVRMTDPKLESIAKVFPKVEKLIATFEAGEMPPLSLPMSFDIFARLTSLQLRFSTLGATAQPQFSLFPSRLQSLSFVATPGPTNGEDIDKLLDVLHQSTQSLQRIELECGACSLQRPHLDKCLSYFERLESISFRNSNRDLTADEDFKLSHPTLKDFDILSIGGVKSVVPEWLPNCAAILLTLPRDLKTAQNLVALPNLHHVLVFASLIPLANEALHFLAEKSGSRRLLSLHVERIASVRGSAETLDCDILSTMITLRRLSLTQELKVPQLARLLQRLPLLEDLGAAVWLVENSFTWLRHPKIANLSLELHSESEDLVPGGTLFLTRDTLPALRKAKVKILKWIGVTVSDLPDLESLTLTPDGIKIQRSRESGPRLSVCSCPQLTEVSLARCSFKNLELVDLMTLQRLWLDSTFGKRKGTLLFKNCPRLRRLTVQLLEDDDDDYKSLLKIKSRFKVPPECDVQCSRW